MRTVVGVFPTIAEADRAATSLEQMGVSRQSLQVVAGNEKSQHSNYVADSRAASGGAAAAAGSGAAIGGGVGLLAGLVALAIPGVGPIVAGGAIATALTGLGVGAAAGGLIGAFSEIGVPDDQAPYYEEAIRRGSVVLSAQVNDSIETDVVRVMDQNGARDVDAEADVWRASGWAGPSLGGMVFDPELSSVPPEPMVTGRMEDPRSGEYRRSGESRQDAATARRNARSYPAKASDSSNRTSNEPHREPTSPLDLSSMPVEASTEHFPERQGPHHLSSDPAWIFGNRWASDPNYAGRGWTDVESNVRSGWEAGNAGSWDVYRDKVRRGFEKKGDDTEDPLSTVDLSSKSGQRGY